MVDNTLNLDQASSDWVEPTKCDLDNQAPWAHEIRLGFLLYPKPFVFSWEGLLSFSGQRNLKLVFTSSIGVVSCAEGSAAGTCASG